MRVNIAAVAILLAWMSGRGISAEDAVPAGAAAATSATVEAATNAPATKSPFNGDLMKAKFHDGLDHLDVVQDQLSTNLVRFVDRVDHLFGDPRLDDDNADTRLNLGIGCLYTDDDGASLVTRTRARLALPCLERRLQLILDNDEEVEDPQKGGGRIADTYQDARPFGGLRYILGRLDRFRVNTDVGVRIGNTSKVFGKVRARYTMPFDNWEFRLSETGGWYSDDGFNEVSEARLTRRLGDECLFRSTSTCTWQEEEDGVKPEQTFSVISEASPKRGYRLDLFGSWPETPNATQTVYRATITYRERIHSDWLYMEISPGVQFPEKYNFDPNPMIQVLFEMVFGDD